MSSNRTWNCFSVVFLWLWYESTKRGFCVFFNENAFSCNIKRKLCYYSGMEKKYITIYYLNEFYFISFFTIFFFFYDKILKADITLKKIINRILLCLEYSSKTSFWNLITTPWLVTAKTNFKRIFFSKQHILLYGCLNLMTKNLLF